MAIKKESKEERMEKLSKTMLKKMQDNPEKGYNRNDTIRVLRKYDVDTIEASLIFAELLRYPPRIRSNPDVEIDMENLEEIRYFAIV